MLITFRTQRTDIQTGEIIGDPRFIAFHYIKSIWFIIEILAIIPFDLFAERDLLILFNLLKIFYIGRMNRIIHNMKASS